MNKLFTPEFINMLRAQLLKRINYEIENRNLQVLDSDEWYLWEYLMDEDRRVLRGIERIEHELYGK